jgi:hypothetical protein
MRDAPTSSATPLLALDAVAIETETTGLDPRKAQTVEMRRSRWWPAASNRKEPCGV